MHDKATHIQMTSGLRYITLEPGTGVEPQAGQQITVHYTGWLNQTDEPGTKFDSSVDRGEPLSFILGMGQVIAGWEEGIKSMQVGEKRRLFIPAHLGYGEYSAGSVIPPHADLIFDVALLDVQ